MTTMSKHACNRGSSDTELHPFGNDANNLTGLQSVRQQKLRLEEAARRQKEILDAAAKNLQGLVDEKGQVMRERDALKEEKAEVTRERDAFKEEKDSLIKTVELKDNALKALGEEIARLGGTARETGSQLATLKNEKSNLAKQVESMSGAINKYSPNLLAREDNCLPCYYHGAIVMIINPKTRLALDSAGDNGIGAHGWEVFGRNTNQIYRLEKHGDPTSIDSPWIIKRHDDGRQLYFFQHPSRDDVHITVCHGSGNEGHWYIGRGQDPGERVGTWLFKNARSGMYMALSNDSAKNATEVKSYKGNAKGVEKYWTIL